MIFGFLIICFEYEPILSVKFYCVVEVIYGCCRCCCSHIHILDCRIPIAGCGLFWYFALHTVSEEQGTTSWFICRFEFYMESNYIWGEHWHSQGIGKFDVLETCVFIDKWLVVYLPLKVIANRSSIFIFGSRISRGVQVVKQNTSIIRWSWNYLSLGTSD